MNRNFEPELRIASPGRINLIGEHTDYNNGFVLPTAIDKKIFLNFRKNGSANKCHVYSCETNKELTVDLNQISKSEEGWENYVLGVLHELKKRTDRLGGFDCVLESTLPIGSGVSSSAALECGLAYGLNELFGLGLTKWEIVALSQAAEHNFVGVNCGIMDQFASVMSKEGHVLLLDCESLEPRFIPMEIQPYKILLLNTNVSHSLASGQYNTRRKECEKGVSTIQKYFPAVSSLRHVTLSMLEACAQELGSTVFNRCSYVVHENERVLQAVDALGRGNLRELGSLMYRSHEGLSTLYGVSCAELDFLVDFSKSFENVLGARMMGGGFGGCTINIVHQDGMDGFIAAASTAYENKFNIQLTSFEALPGEGTSIV